MIMVVGETHHHPLVGRRSTLRGLQDVSHPAGRVKRGWKVDRELPKQLNK